MVAKAEELAQEHGWFLPRQFENEANAAIHMHTTAEEIVADFGAEGLDYRVTGFGTGGTLKGVGRVLRARSPQTKIARDHAVRGTGPGGRDRACPATAPDAG